MIFNLLKATILGFIEGLTEFLPISSTGHLILANQILSFDKNFTVLFDIVIQLGAILSVLILFWQELWPLGKDQEKNKIILTTWKKIIIAVLPALFFGALLGDLIEKYLFNFWTVGITLIIGGIILLLLERKNKISTINDLQNIGFKTAFYIGLIQCLAMIPGTSRSAATIIGAMILGAERKIAAKFSFFLAIPTLIAASGYSLIKSGFSLTNEQIIILIIGFIFSFLTALGVIKLFLKYIQNNDFKLFGYYRIILGLIIFIIFLTNFFY